MARNLTMWKHFSSSDMCNVFHKPGSSPFHVPNPIVVRALLTSMGDLFLAVKWWFCWPTANGALMVIQLSLRTGVAQNCQEMKKPHVSFVYNFTFRQIIAYCRENAFCKLCWRKRMTSEISGCGHDWTFSRCVTPNIKFAKKSSARNRQLFFGNRKASNSRSFKRTNKKLKKILVKTGRVRLRILQQWEFLIVSWLYH